MNVAKLADEITTLIVGMSSGDVSSISDLTYTVLGKQWDGDMFRLMNLVEYGCARAGIYLDRSRWGGMMVGLPYNLDFKVTCPEETGALIDDAQMCVLHCWAEDDRDVDDPEAVPLGIKLAFKGSVSGAEDVRFCNLSGDRFVIDCVQLNSEEYMVAMLDEVSGKPFRAFSAYYDELLDIDRWYIGYQEESRVFVVSKEPIDIEAAMADCRDMKR